MQVWKLSETLDSIENLISTTSAVKGDSNTPMSLEGHYPLNNWYSESLQMSEVLSSKDNGREILSRFSSRRCQEKLSSRH